MSSWNTELPGIIMVTTQSYGTLSVTCWGMLDIIDKLDVDFDLFPKSLLQQNQIKSMVIAKAKCKGKKVCPS